jgi:hypothetical protein
MVLDQSQLLLTPGVVRVSKRYFRSVMAYELTMGKLSILSLCNNHRRRVTPRSICLNLPTETTTARSCSNGTRPTS